MRKHGVYVTYGKSGFKLTTNQVQLIADALAIIEPDSQRQENDARKMQSAFEALAEYAASVR